MCPALSRVKITSFLRFMFRGVMNGDVFCLTCESFWLTNRHVLVQASWMHFWWYAPTHSSLCSILWCVALGGQLHYSRRGRAISAPPFRCRRFGAGQFGAVPSRRRRNVPDPFAAASAGAFCAIPTWLDTQHNLIILFSLVQRESICFFLTTA